MVWSSPGSRKMQARKDPSIGDKDIWCAMGQAAYRRQRLIGQSLEPIVQDKSDLLLLDQPVTDWPYGAARGTARGIVPSSGRKVGVGRHHMYHQLRSDP